MLRPPRCPRATRAVELNRAAATPPHLAICHAAAGERHRLNPGGRPMMGRRGRAFLSSLFRHEEEEEAQQGRRALPWILLGRRSVPLHRHPQEAADRALYHSVAPPGARPIEPRRLREGRESGASAECGAYGSAYSWRGGRRQVMPRVPSTYSAGGGVGVGKHRFGGGSFILSPFF
jgi:hypothetical protein